MDRQTKELTFDDFWQELKVEDPKFCRKVERRVEFRMKFLELRYKIKKKIFP